MTTGQPAHNFASGDVVIRIAGTPDQRAVLDLFNRGLHEGLLRENDTGADVENLQEGYFSDDGASGFWVACIGDQVLGMIGVQCIGDNIAEIRRLRVGEPFRRRGIGTRLLEHAIQFCRDRGYLKVVLDVRIERGPAIAMFEKFGFTLARDRDIGSRKTLDFYIDLYSDQKP